MGRDNSIQTMSISNAIEYTLKMISLLWYVYIYTFYFINNHNCRGVNKYHGVCLLARQLCKLGSLLLLRGSWGYNIGSQVFTADPSHPILI